MLLSQTFKTGSVVASPLGSSSRSQSALVVRRISNPVTRASVSGGGSSESKSPGWLESKVGKVTSYADKKLNGDGKAAVPEAGNVEMKGTALVVKKLAMLDVMDRFADLKDDASELFHGKHVSIQLMSGEIDPSTGKGRLSSEVNFAGWVTIFDPLTAEQIKFETKFSVPPSFGTPVAIVVRNTHPNEFLLESFTLDLPDKTVAHYITNSWVYNTETTKPIGPRIFFHNKAYLPADTPDALKALREKELQDLRGDDTEVRVESDRIYGYSPYDDLGNVDDPKKGGEEAYRHPLGGNKEFPFPLRLRTGRPRAKFNKDTESRVKGDFYVPSDERFDYSKRSDNEADGIRSKLHAAKTVLSSKLPVFGKTTFQNLDEIHKLYASKAESTSKVTLPGKVDNADKGKAIRGGMRYLKELMAERAEGEKFETFKFPIPKVLRDDNVWATDSEFAREYLAGCNSIEIERVTEFPIKSNLPAAEYGDPESEISAKHIEGQLEGLSIEQALSEKKLFTVDYHDTFLPWVQRINALPDVKTYASRVLLFLSKDETLKPIAIELVRIKTPGGKKSTRVFTPIEDSAKKRTLWTLAKAHAINNEMTMHQVVSHFTLCHVCFEPAIISGHRHLSKLHPIMQLLHPHFKHTLFVNTTARMNLINSDGILEQIYTPRKYALQLASACYRDNWTFSGNALPTDLIKRGMAEADPKAKFGVKLAIEDYPYAADGLELWTALKEWHKEYIDIFYKDDSAVQADPELNNWWTEFRDVGHGDMKNAPGWPDLDSKESLVEILTTVVWICTAMHAPINFGQFDYAGWMPQHPSITHKLIPEEGSKEMKEFEANPDKFWLSMISDSENTVTAMAVYEVVAAHAPDEQYIGERTEGWTANEQVKGALERYRKKLKEIDAHIVKRNEDQNLKNRRGGANFPFELLRPSSTPGVTAKGVPNSITV